MTFVAFPGFVLTQRQNSFPKGPSFLSLFVFSVLFFLLGFSHFLCFSIQQIITLFLFSWPSWFCFFASFFLCNWVVVVYLFPFTVDELMSLGSGVVSSSKNMGFDDNKEGGEKSVNEKVQANRDADDGGEQIGRQMSETSLYATDQEDEDDERSKLQLGPQCTLKEQLEKDKVCLSLNFKIITFSNFFFLSICLCL